MDFYLQIGTTLPNKEDDLFIAGNKAGILFQVLEKTSPILYSEYTQAFTANLHHRGLHPTRTGVRGRLQQMVIDFFDKQRDVGGMSGSPVYNTNGQVVGVLSRAISYRPDSHLTFFQSLDQLQNLINKEPKLHCTNFKKCIEEELRRLEFDAENGNLLAQDRLFFHRFEGVKKEPKKVIDYLKPLAQQGLISAYVNLAHAYSVAGNDALAFYWFEQLAQKGYPNAQLEVRDMYLQGRGVRQDILKALYWQRRANNQGR